MKQEDKVRIDVDEEYYIMVDRWNWTVIERRPSKNKKGKDGWMEAEEAHCHDLAHALKSIVELKTLRASARHGIEDYLAWVDSTYTQMTKAVLLRREELTEALELNKVM